MQGSGEEERRGGGWGQGRNILNSSRMQSREQG